MKRKTVKAACSSCYSTGLYQGFCEAKGTAVICHTCGGTGCEEISYTPFERRRGKRGIKSVFKRGGWVSNDATREAITYAEFRKLYPSRKSNAR